MNGPPAADVRTDARRHTVFAALWAVAAFVHQASFAGWRWDHPLGWAYTAATAAVLLRPSSLALFAAFVATDLSGIAYASPKQPNHILFTGLADLALLAGTLAPLARGLRGDDARAAAIRGYGPAVRTSVIVLYFWVVFHKLNESYFDPGVSAASEMYRELADGLPLFPRGAVAEGAVPWLVIGAEAAIPVLLACGRTAVAGTVTGLVFHFLLGLHPARGVYSFSATLLPLFWLFVPAARTAAFGAPRGTTTFLRALAAVLVGGYVAAQGARALGADDTDVWQTNLRAGHWLWGAITLCVAGAYAWNLRRTRDAAPVAGERLVPSGAFAAVPALVLANGLCPYLGLKTESSFAMFSNLATERGRSNHLLVPASVQVTGWLRDTVEVLDCSKADLARFRSDRYEVTFMQLRCVRTRDPDGFRATFVRDGAEQTFDAARPETHASIPEVPWIVSKLVQFRPVDRDERVRARH